MRKTRKQILKGHVTHMPILMTFFLFSLKATLFVLFFFLFSLLHFNLTIYFYFLVLSEYLGNKLGGSTIGKIGKTAFIAEFLTVANTLISYLQNDFSIYKFLGK